MAFGRARGARSASARVICLPPATRGNGSGAATLVRFRAPCRFSGHRARWALGTLHPAWPPRPDGPKWHKYRYGVYHSRFNNG
jgi:hypothetical protein